MNYFQPRQPNPPQNINCGNVSGSYNNIWNNCDVSVTDERRQILEWLSPLAPRQRHRDVRRSQVKGVNDGLLETDRFVNWNVGADGVVSPVLFGCGDPGAGKTHVSSLVIETLCNQNYGKHAAVACLYCDFQARQEQPTVYMLGAILKQVVGGLEHIPGEIEAAFKRSKKLLDGRELELSEILKLLLSSLRMFKRSYICVDALDEFPREHRPELFKSLAQIIHESPCTRLFLTGRPHIWDEIERYFTGAVKVQIKPTEEDIKKYLITKLSNDTQPEAMDQDLREEILGTVPKKIAGIFLLVSLSVNSILAQSTISRRRKKLRLMTNGTGVGGAYDETLGRIGAQEGDRGKLGIDTLMWISQSERPLHAEELRHALSIENDSTELDPQNVPAIEALLSCCLGLVTMDEDSRVRLIHLTLQEHLCGHRELFGSAHSKMAEACLTYLNFQNIKDLPPNLGVPPKSTPFLEYASCYWGTHARRELSEHTKSLAVQLLDRYDHHSCAKLLLVNRENSLFYRHSVHPLSTSMFTGLHAIAWFGIAEIAVALIKLRSWDVNGKDAFGITPLLWAVAKKNEEVCKILLGIGDADPNISDSRGRTPLFRACGNGYEGIVGLLLERKEVDLDLFNNDGRTPLSSAARYGHEGIVKLLLQLKEVNPGSSDKSGQTSLWGAARYGHEGVVRLLLQRKEVNPDASDKSGQTPLWGAARYGHEGIVKLLLQREEVDPDASDKSGQTPLWWAARYGHEGIVRLLLQRKEVKPDSTDKSGQTPLWWAARYGHESIVRLLLQHKEVNPNSSYKSGQTPLSGAARYGHGGVVKLLLQSKEANPDSSDKAGQTPLRRAAQYGHEGIVELLLQCNEVNPDSSDNNGQTPLSGASRNGHEGIVKLLLQRKEVNPDSSDNNGQTPLSWASWNGHEGIVKLLLQRKEVNPDSSDNSGQTPLSWAAWDGHEGIVRLLLQRNEVNPDSSDNDGQTPLSGAACIGHEDVIELLLQREGLNPDASDNNGRTPLSWAAGPVPGPRILLHGKGHNASEQGIVKLFLKRKDVRPDSPDNRGRTPLLWAAIAGLEGMTKLLLEQHEVNPNHADNDGKTPLMLAAENGHQGVVRLLLERLSVNHNASNEEETLSAVTGLSGGAPAGGTIPDPSNRGNLKRQSQTLEDDSVDPSNTFQVKRSRYSDES